MVPEMKIHTILTIGALSLAACGGSKKTTTTTTTTTTPAAEGVPCEQEIALECPAGQIDGCLKTPAEGTTHACVAE